MIESDRIRRYKVCFICLENDKLVKKFIILKAKTGTRAKDYLNEKYGDLDYYKNYEYTNDTRKITEPGILYIRPMGKIKDGDITARE